MARDIVGEIMTTYAVVRFKPKPGLEQEFVDRYTSLKREFDGLRKAALAKTAEGEYFAVAEWESEAHLAAARPLMAGNLATFRETLQFIGTEPNVTEAFSGKAIYHVPTEKGDVAPGPAE
jgi:hypothetical protein